jgi:hypothetical protein
MLTARIVHFGLMLWDSWQEEFEENGVCEEEIYSSFDRQAKT